MFRPEWCAGARRHVLAAGAISALLLGSVPAAVPEHPGAAGPKRNIILFIADGMRRGSINPTDTPALYKVRTEGVDFANSHSLFPTFTTANASAIATGHYLGDTGDFSNTEYVGFPIFNDIGRTGTQTPFLESNQVLADLDEHMPAGNYLNEESLLALARGAGYNTAAIGKIGPVGIQDVTQLRIDAAGTVQPTTTVFIDDATGSAASPPLSPTLQSALTKAGLALAATPRNQPQGNVATAGTLVANLQQQGYFIDATTKAVLPAFIQSPMPFALVYWSRDPDGTQHNQGDSLNKLVPGINGPTARAGVANADGNLAQILAFLQANPTVLANTDVFVTSDHGFATISKHEIDASGAASKAYATGFTYLGTTGAPEVIPGWLPPGFLAIDLAHALTMPLFDPDTPVAATSGSPAFYQTVDPSGRLAGSRQRPASGNGLIGGTGAILDKTDAQVIVAANGGSDLIYVPTHDATLVRRLVAFLSRQDYVGGLFVDSAYGHLPGTLRLSDIGLEGGAVTPRPAISVNFKSFSLDPTDPLQTAVQIADTVLQEGQGMHGSLGRDNTFNNMAAIGPDFKRGYVDRAPVGNADVARTLAGLLGLSFPANGPLEGRRLVEALVGGHGHRVGEPRVAMSSSAAHRSTVVEYQTYEGRRYFDRACFVDLDRHRQRQHGRAVRDRPCQ